MLKQAVIYFVAFVPALFAVWLLPLGFSRIGGAAVVAAALLAAALAKLAESVVPLWQVALLLVLLLLAVSYLLDRWFGTVLYRSAAEKEEMTGRKEQRKGSTARPVEPAVDDGGKTAHQHEANGLNDWSRQTASEQEAELVAFQAAWPDEEASRHGERKVGEPALDEPELAAKDDGAVERKEMYPEFFKAPLPELADGAEQSALFPLEPATGERTVEYEAGEQQEEAPIEPLRCPHDWLDELPVAVTPDIEAVVLQAGAAVSGPAGGSDDRSPLWLLDIDSGEKRGAGLAPVRLEPVSVSADESGPFPVLEPETPPALALFGEEPLDMERVPHLEMSDVAGYGKNASATEEQLHRQGEGQQLEHHWQEEEQLLYRLEESQQPEQRGREEESERPARMIGPEVVQAVVLELRLNRRRLGAADYERCIRRCLDAPLSDRDYYVLARLLMEHYVVEQQYGKLAAWLEELADRFRAYPAVAEELALWRQFAATLNSWGEQDES
ncbi:hypothetical protein [Geobacillus zalihae]